MNFADALKKASQWTRTENDAVALNTTGDALLDLFSTVGALREAEDERINLLFSEAYKEHKLLATKIAFYARDIRGGLGERKTFRTIIKYMANHHPEALIPNLDLIGVYGRFDDLYSLIDTPLEPQMWEAMKKQFEEDKANLAKENTAISLLAKWIKTADASSKNTRALGIKTALKLGYKVRDFKILVRQMRKRLGVIEVLMSQNRWEEINYSAVPSRAMLLYRKAFLRHDESRYQEFIQKAVKGEVKINAGTLYPYDLVEKIWDYAVDTGGYYQAKTKEDETVEAQWRQLPNYVEEGTNALVMADMSGSMMGRPMNTALGLAIYFAERNKGAYHNMWLSFSANPKIHMVKGETLAQKINSFDMRDWTMNTDLTAAFDLILDIALKNKVPAEDLPKSLIVISDMEIDYCGNKEWSFYDKIKAKFAKNGYELPNIIFWNVNSRHDVYHADSKRKGVQLVSGQSASTFKTVMDCINLTPIEAMLKTLSDERYSLISVS